MRRILVLSMLLLLAVASLSNATTITILNVDGPGEGFNDPTPVAPVGGNMGVTLGQQRLNVFMKAADIWSGLLNSSVPIIVRAAMDPQTCTATSATLGSTSNGGLWANFPGALVPNVWYVEAEANKLGGVDLDPAAGTGYDMNVVFNSNLNGQVSCLNGVGWYLGYDGNEGTNIELLPVVLHEMGHGLGFSSGLGSTGAEPGGLPTLYETFMHDNTQNLDWNQMTQAQRAASAINPNNVVWDGPCVTGHAPFVLTGVPRLWNNSGPPLNPTYSIGLANFGPPTFSVTGNLVLEDDATGPNVNDGCTPLVNAGAIAGNVAVVDRGNCTFVIKAQQAQAAGAIALVVVNNAAGPAPGLGGFDASITIPVVSLSQADGNAIKAQMLLGTVNVTIGFDNSGPKAGADALNHVQLYTPNPFQGGSSLSHWDVSTYPNLLMEPAINNNLSSAVDLTYWMFGDIGWHDDCNPVAVAISNFNARPTDGGVRLDANFLSTLGDANFVVVYRAGRGSDDFRGIATVNAPENGKFSYVDETVRPGGAYRYKISVIDGDGEFFSPVAEIRLPGARLELSQNVPNPFNPTTTIRFSLPASTRVSLAIYNASGQLVRTLVDDVRGVGTHNVTWDGHDNAGNTASSGVYFYRLTAGKFSETKKMVMLK